MIILLFGPPGCGKGTQAALLSHHLQVPSISTGEMFRAECKAGTKLGKEISRIMSSGGLVGDDIVNAVVASRIGRPDCAGGFVLDGYPRTVGQAAEFARLLDYRSLPEPVVVHLDVADDALVTRLTARRQCPRCLRIYNTISQPPRIAEICDDDAASLFTREDDREPVIRERLRAYRDQTGPVLQWYGRSVVREVNGGMTSPEVAKAVERALGSAVGASH